MEKNADARHREAQGQGHRRAKTAPDLRRAAAFAGELAAALTRQVATAGGGRALLDAQTVSDRGPRFGHLGVGQALTVQVTGAAARSTPVFQSFPPRALSIAQVRDKITIKNELRMPVSFLLFFAPESVVKDLNRMVQAAGAARRLANGGKDE